MAYDGVQGVEGFISHLPHEKSPLKVAGFPGWTLCLYPIRKGTCSGRRSFSTSIDSRTAKASSTGTISLIVPVLDDLAVLESIDVEKDLLPEQVPFRLGKDIGSILESADDLQGTFLMRKVADKSFNSLHSIISHEVMIFEVLTIDVFGRQGRILPFPIPSDTVMAFSISLTNKLIKSPH